MLAGQRLDQSRKALYDFPSEDEIDEDAYDPTRRGNFDLADASQLAMETEMSLRDQALEADKLRKAAQAEIEASGEVKRVQRGFLNPLRRKGRRAPFLRYILPLDVYIAQ